MTGDELLRETTAYLHEKIPLTRAMGVEVVSYEGGQLVVTAPLEPNHNHIGTAFGGSLNALATLAGYVLLWIELRDRTAHLVIRQSQIQFHRPVRGELRAVCQAPEESIMDDFREGFARKGKARLDLRVEMYEGGELAVEYTATFVAMRSESPKA
jgi:thioesterase domain-containing protein